jgi:integrase
MSDGHIRARSPGAWELKYDVGRDPQTGRRVTRYATVRGSKADARRKLRELLSAVDRGAHIEPSKLTVAELVRQRIATWDVGARTREHYQTVALMVTRHLGETLVQRLTTTDVEQWHGKLREAGLSRTTIGHAHRLLVRALADAVRHHLVGRNVAREQPLPKARGADKTNKVRTVKSEQIPDLLKKLEGSAFHVPVVVALYTGLRRGEQLALRWLDVDLDGKVMTVARALDETKADGITVKLTKTEAGERTISLPDIVIDALRRHRKAQLERSMLLGLGRPPDDALVFPADDGGHMGPRAFSLRWLRCVRRLGLPAGHWHALRHTHASMLISAGVDVVTVSRRLGHADPKVTLGIYAHLFTKDDRAAADAINAALGM